MAPPGATCREAQDARPPANGVTVPGPSTCTNCLALGAPAPRKSRASAVRRRQRCGRNDPEHIMHHVQRAQPGARTAPSTQTACALPYAAASAAMLPWQSASDNPPHGHCHWHRRLHESTVQPPDCVGTHAPHTHTHGAGTLRRLGQSPACCPQWHRHPRWASRRARRTQRRPNRRACGWRLDGRAGGRAIRRPAGRSGVRPGGRALGGVGRSAGWLVAWSLGRPGVWSLGRSSKCMRCNPRNAASHGIVAIHGIAAAHGLAATLGIAATHGVAAICINKNCVTSPPPHTRDRPAPGASLNRGHTAQGTAQKEPKCGEVCGNTRRSVARRQASR